MANLGNTLINGMLVVIGRAEMKEIAGSLEGNAATATKLQTSRKITLTGQATGTVTTDFSGDVSIATTVTADSHEHSADNIKRGTLPIARGGTGYYASGGEYGRKATESKGGRGGNGGSGGGGGSWADVNASWTPSGSYNDSGQGQFSGGANGTDGGNASYGSNYRVGDPGTGQGTTTKAFGESTGTIYGGSGQSGIVIIRWAEQ